MITLHGFGPGFGVPDPSPFVLKVDAYLRMAGIEFDRVDGVANLRKAPKGKLPFIEDGGNLIADSSFIIAHLEETRKQPLDRWLSAEQRGLAYLLMKSLDENLYWCIVHSRWIRDDTWPLIKSGFFGALPFPLKAIVPWVARRSVRDALKKHGIGKHTDADIEQIADRSLHSLSDVLGDKPYFFGDRPCVFDATAYGFLAEMIVASIDNALNRRARAYGNLVAFCERVNERYYAGQHSSPRVNYSEPGRTG